MKVGYFGPPPSARTGVADYSAALFRELGSRGEIKTESKTCDISLYHIGNNQLNGTAYHRALKTPGVVVLHDAVLQHFYLGSFRRVDYVSEFVYNYGEFSRAEAEALWADSSLSSQDPRFFERPMLRRIVSSALGVVTHNPAAARAVREHAPGTHVFEVPHFYQTPVPPAPTRVAAFRTKIGVPSNGFLFAVFGYLRESKRLISVLKAFGRLHRLSPETRLIVAGEFVSPGLERASSALLDQPGVVRLPHLSAADLDLASFSTDCCVNLRYPTAGETSGIAIRLMGAGKPVIVTEGEEWARIPETAVFRIPAGPAEPEALFDAMVALSQNPSTARYMGEQAARHIQRYHSLASSGEEYWKILCRIYDSHS